LRKLLQENLEFEVSLDYIAKPCLKNKQTKKQSWEARPGKKKKFILKKEARSGGTCL
jgi:hypothetical protein